MTNYRLESTDPATGIITRLGLSASSDEQAMKQMERVRWKHENAGERRELVLYRPAGGCWVEVARTGSRSR